MNTQLIKTYNNIIKSSADQRNQVENSIQQAQINNLGQIRNYWLQLILASGAASIGLIPMIDGKSELIKTPDLAITGLFVLIFGVIYGAVNITIFLRLENAHLAKLSFFIKKSASDFNQQMEKIMRENVSEEVFLNFYIKFVRENSEEEEKIKHGNNKIRAFFFNLNHYVLGLCFVSGIIFMVLSFLIS